LSMALLKRPEGTSPAGAFRTLGVRAGTGEHPEIANLPRWSQLTRIGKIARLPVKIRENLNNRLRDGQPGRELVGWLNALPEVRAVLKAQFAGRAITSQNLSEWKGGGYREWLAQQEAISQIGELAATAGQLDRAAEGRLSDHLATLLAARYAGALADWNGVGTREFRRLLRSMRGFCRDVVELRRGDHNAAYLKIEQERLVRDLAKEENARPRSLTPEETKRKIDEIFGIVRVKTEEPDSAPTSNVPISAGAETHALTSGEGEFPAKSD
jgi:hypothetical protein